MARYYSIPKRFLLLYCELMGLDDKSIQDADIEDQIEFRSFEGLREKICEVSKYGFNTFSVLPSSSLQIADGMENLIERACSDFYSYDERDKKMDFLNSAIGILYDITQINVLPENSNQYVAHFHRVNELLLLGFSMIEAFESDKLPTFYEDIKNADAANILKALSRFKGTPQIAMAVLALTKLTPNENIDHDIFDGSNKVDLKRVLEVITQSLKTQPIVEEKESKKVDAYFANRKYKDKVSQKIVQRFKLTDYNTFVNWGTVAKRLSIEKSYSLTKKD